MKRIERYMPIAIDVVEDIILRDYNLIEPEWDNAISNFGAAVRQMGMFTAVAAFSSDSEGSKVSKSLLMKCVLRIIVTGENDVCTKDDTLKKMVKDNPENMLLKKKIIDASVALKLALRLFIDNPKEEEENKDDED